MEDFLPFCLSSFYIIIKSLFSLNFPSFKIKILTIIYYGILHTEVFSPGDLHTDGLPGCIADSIPTTANLWRRYPILDHIQEKHAPSVSF